MAEGLMSVTLIGRFRSSISMRSTSVKAMTAAFAAEYGPSAIRARSLSTLPMLMIVPPRPSIAARAISEPCTSPK